MTTSTCVRCGRPTPDGYADVHCRDRAAAQLTEIADMVPAARDIAYGLSANLSGSGGSGKPGSRLPLDLGATARCDSVANALGGWVRHVIEERGVHPDRVPPGFDVIAPAARFLGEHLEWFRHRPECDEFLGDVEAAVRVMRGIVRGPAAQRYLGPCGAVVGDEEELFEGEWQVPVDAPTCEGDVYARDNAATGRCRTCGAEVSTAERQAWLDSEVRQRAFSRTDIEDAYGIKANTMTTWWLRGKLKAYWVTDTGLHVEWIELKPEPALKGDAKQAREQEIKAEHKARGTKVFYLADVLDLAVADAARREEARAERARRKTQTEGAAA